MSGRRLPTLFVSHGSPMLAITESPARRFLVELGLVLPRPRAIVVFSAHHEWIPLGLMFPDADVPVVQVSIASRRAPAEHVALGRALRTLRDAGVLLLGSGGATHNLGLYFTARGDGGVPDWVFAFAEWTTAAIAAGRVSDLERYREIAPHAVDNHPTPEHFLPLFEVLGAAFGDERGVRIHSSCDRGVLALDAFAFGFDDWPGPELPAATAAVAV